MKAKTLRAHRTTHTLLRIATAIGMFACLPLYAYDVSDEYAKREKLTPARRKVLNAAIVLDEQAHDQAKAADYDAEQGNVQAAACKYARALELHREALKGWERVLGPERWETLSVRHNLGLLLFRARKRDEAVAEFRAILAINQRVWGMKHNGTWCTWNVLAGMLELQGKHDEALAEYRAVLPWMLRGYGPENENTLETQMHLANVLQTLGKNAEAEQEHRAVLKVKERVMGAEHPQTLQSCYHLGICLEAQGKLTEALAFVWRADRRLTKYLGADHSDSMKAKAARERIEAALAK